MRRKKNISIDFNDLDFRIFSYRTRIELKLLLIKLKVRKKIYCDRGYHSIYSGFKSISNNKGLSIRSDFVRCRVCATLYFTNKENKESYLKIRDHDFSMLENFIGKGIKRKRRVRTFDK